MAVHWGGRGFGHSSRYTLAFGGTPTPAPVNEMPPEILGTPQDGQIITINIGTWSNATSFEAEIRSTESTPTVYFARQAIAWDDEFTIPDTAIGKSLVVEILGTGPGGTVSAVSAAFGPIIAAGDTFILGVAWAQTAQSVPSGWEHLLAPSGIPNSDALFPNVAGAQSVTAGWQGTSVGTAIISTVTSSFGDGRLAGRFSPNGTYSAYRFTVAGLNPGSTYKIYAGLGRGAAATNTWFAIVRDDLTTVLQTLALTAVGATEVRDAAGAIATYATWAAASAFGGGFVEIVAPSDGIIHFGRPAAGGSGCQLNCLAITRKAGT